MDSEIFEAARIDGASRLQIIMRITLPYLRPIIILMTLFSVGRIFYGDFAYAFTTSKENYWLYDFRFVNAVNQRFITHRIMLTMGVRF